MDEDEYLQVLIRKICWN